MDPQFVPDGLESGPSFAAYLAYSSAHICLRREDGGVMWAGCDKALGCIEGALYVLEIGCLGWRQPGESLGWETGTLLSSNWLLNNLTTQLAGPGRGSEQECSGRRLRLPGLRYLPAVLAPECAAFCEAPLDDPLKPRWDWGVASKVGSHNCLWKTVWLFRCGRKDSLRHWKRGGGAFQT